MNTLRINVANKIATYHRRDGSIVCGNSDYQIKFVFDEEWADRANKTARFIWGGQYYDVEFEGDTCNVPVITGTDEVEVGVYAGDLNTTTGATIECVRSILCKGGAPHPETGQHYTAEAVAAAEAAKASEEAAKSSKEEAAASAAAAETARAEAEARINAATRVAQTTGDSATAVMSQKAGTEEIKVLDSFCKDRYAEFEVDDWVVGSINPDTFKDLASTTRIRSGYHTFNGINKLRIANDQGYKSLWHAYTYDGTNYTRVDGNTSFSTGAYDIPIVSGYYYRFLIAIDGDKTASLDFANKVKFHGWIDDYSVEIGGNELGLEYGNISNGVEGDSTARVRSDFLRVGKGTLFKTTNYAIVLAQYDLDKNFISMVTDIGGTWYKGVEVDRDCLVRLVIGGKGGVYLDGATATLTAIKNDVKAYIRDCEGDDRYTIIGDKVGWKYSTLDPATGGERLSTGRLLSDYIRADAHTVIESTTQNIGVYQYDENRNFVSFGTEVTWYTRKVTLVDGYIRIVIGGKYGVYLDGTEDVDALTKAVTIKIMRNKNSLLLDNENVVESEKRLPTYWAEYLDGKKDSIYTERLNIGNHGDIFSFFTDYHMQSNATNTAAILKHIKKEHRIDKHFFGGDIADSTSTANAKVLMDNFAKDFADLELLPSLGNHEVQLYNSTYTNPTESEVYGLVFKHLETKAHVTLDSGLYFALDNHAQKIRYIVLNTHTDTSYSLVNDTAQVNWFVERMTELGEGWNVVVLFHRYYDGVNASTGAHNTSPDGAFIAAILGALKTKGSYSGNSYTFNFSSAKAGVIALISGHTHRDYSEVTAHGFPIIATRCDAYNGAMQEIPRTLGDVTEQAIDLFFVDTTARTIKTIRLGAGEDREWTY
jgi:hypothetical protein